MSKLELVLRIVKPVEGETMNVVGICGFPGRDSIGELYEVLLEFGYVHFSCLKAKCKFKG